MTMNIILKMAKANLQTLFRDRRAVFILFAMPIVITAVLTFALSGIFGSKASIPSFPVVVYNQDAGPLGKQLVQVLQSQSPQMKVHVESSLTAARLQTTTNRANVVVWIEKNYSQSIQSGHQATVDVEAQSNHSTEQSVVQSVIQSYGQALADQVYAASQLPGAEVAVQSANIQSLKTSLHPVTTGAYYAVGMMVMFMLTHAINRAGAMVRDKRGDLYRRMMASPASRHAISMGHLVSNFVVLVIYGGILLLCYRFILNIHLGPFDQTVMLLVAYSVALSGISVALGSWINNQRVMDSLGQLGTQIAAILGGSFWPLFSMPKVMQLISRALPNGQVLTSMIHSVVGIQTQALFVPFVYLVCLGIICGLLGSLRYGLPIEKGGAAG